MADLLQNVIMSRAKTLNEEGYISIVGIIVLVLAVIGLLALCGGEV